jgi:hypothetical protein
MNPKNDRLTFAEAQGRQRTFDAEHWQVDESEFEKLRHITLHLAVLLGKLGRYCERIEHGKDIGPQIIVGEVVPDLVLYALQLANLLGVDLGDLYVARLETNAARSGRGENGGKDDRGTMGP